MIRVQTDWVQAELILSSHDWLSFAFGDYVAPCKVKVNCFLCLTVVISRSIRPAKHNLYV